MSDTIDLPLIYQGETVGQLKAAPRTPGEDFSQADRRLPENIAHQAGSAARAVQLTTALQQSGRQIVTARGDFQPGDCLPPAVATHTPELLAPGAGSK